MFFRPSFCAHCGVKVERPEWFPWTSRRFCTVCEVEFKGQEMIPRVVVGLGIIIGIFGFGSYLNSGTKQTDLPALKQSVRTSGEPEGAKRKASEVATTAVQSNSGLPNSGQPEQRNLTSTTGISQTSDQAKPRVERAESINFCGAETKKGTPCSRRVKGNTRCFQHAGMPSIAVSERPDARAQK